MKRLTSLGTITLTLLLASMSGVSASENQADKLSSRAATSSIAAKLETDRLVTGDRSSSITSLRNTNIREIFAIVETNQRQDLELSEDFKNDRDADGKITLIEF